MNRDQARALVAQTFTQAFDKTRFAGFVVNVLNHIDVKKAGAWNRQYIKDAFKDHVQRYERLGTYTSTANEKLDVLIVYLTTASKLERARTAMRNFVADHLKTRDEKDAALVAFVSPSEKQWRFSYVKMDYESVEKESGKIGIETRLTPARRFSYLVGEGESCHTAQTRFLALLQDTGTNPTLAEIEDAFSVEAVTKEFFTKYAQLFGEIQKALDSLVENDKAIRQEFSKTGANTADFAKKLMGQIVFLYFLQKKGWLGVPKDDDWGSGPHDFLRQLAAARKGKYENFFNDVLEPLFYDTLATDRGHAAWCDRFQSRIPFLNGGLFEPLGGYNWRKIDIPLPNSLFTNTKQFEGDIVGTGVLDIFDRYNFTVNEAEPLEKEVAIDPEMLGKVFENLIEENLRKGLGAYYTPREIVHFMCQETLVNYLDHALNKDKELVPRAEIETFIQLGEQISHYEAVDAKYLIKMPKSIQLQARVIDHALEDITVCDPAVGSGAFPVGMMTEIVRARSALTPYFNDLNERTPYKFKHDAIQHSLYGVDIDAGAIEIAKLRLWLSLVVDEDAVKQVKPLPNLDYKIVAGNSLLGFPFKSQRLHDIEKLKLQFFDELDHKAKAQLKEQIDSELNKCIAASKSTLGYEVAFDFGLNFSEVFHRKRGFDVLIANPPYVGEKGHKEIFAEIKKGSLGSFYRGKVDIFYFFFHLALNLGRDTASVAFITTNYYPTADGALTLRYDFRKRSAIRNLMNFGDLKIFESALGQHNMITILSKSQEPAGDSHNCVTKRNGLATQQVLRSILRRTDQETQYFTVPQEDLYEGEAAYIRLQGARGAKGDHLHGVLNKLSASGASLGDLCTVNIGMRTGADKVTQNYIDTYGLNLMKGEGIYVITDQERERMHLNRVEQAMLLPFFKNSDIDRYHCKSRNDLWLIDLTYPKYKDVNWGTIPHIHKHIVRFETILRNRRSNDNGLLSVIDAGYWWCYTMRQLDFSQEKIVSPQRSDANTFAYSQSLWVASMDVYFITKRDPSISLKFILSLLNSKPYYLWLYHKGKRKGKALELYQTPLSEIPIKGVEPSIQKPFIELVDRILEAKKRDPETDTTPLEKRIDNLVYQLYDLQQPEIAAIEKSAG
jgi:type I restriction-modification system DNA methylase subunit